MTLKKIKIGQGQAQIVTSFSNPVIKNLRALSQRKTRNSSGLFLAEGIKLIRDALDLKWKIKTLVLTDSRRSCTIIGKVVTRALESGALVIKTSEKIMKTITNRNNPQTVVGVFEQRWHALEKVIFPLGSLFLGLDRVRDPGNLGTIVRTADAVGVTGIFLIGESTNPFSLEAVRATMGSIFVVPLYRLLEEQFLAWRKQFPGSVIGSHLHGSIDFRALRPAKKPLFILMGNEQHGLSDNLAKFCDKLVCIPQVGHADSLNLSVATGIILYEVRREVFSF